MKELGRYDTELNMFVEQAKPVKLGTLKFLRFIAEKEGRTLSEPAGEFALGAAIVGEKREPFVKVKREIVPGD